MKPDLPPDYHFQTETATHDLRGRSVRGGAVTIAGQMLKLFVQMGSVAILARLLKPEAFGLVAMVTVVVVVLESFKDLGLSAATVQRENITHEEVSTLFWVNAGLGVVAGLLMIPLAPLLAWLYHEPALVGITMWLGVGFALSGLSTQHLALMRRQMRFTALTSVQTGAEIVGAGAAIAAAAVGADYWSLVIQRLAWALWLAAGSWAMCRWRPGLPMRPAGVKALLVYGANVTGSNLVSTVVRGLDQMLIGWWWGAYPLGLYERAYKILLVPINNLNAPLFTVAMPALSRLADQPQAYRRAYLGMVEKLNMVVMPCAALLIAVPDQIVRALFGEQWLAASPIVAWLGVAALYNPVAYTCGWLFMTQDRTAEMLRWGLFGSALSAVTIVAGLPFGAEGVAASFAVGGLVIRQPFLFWMAGRRGPVSSVDLYRSLGPSAAAAALIVAILMAARRFGMFDALNLFESLVVSGGISLVVSLACFAAIPQSRAALREFVKLSGAFGLRRASV